MSFKIKLITLVSIILLPSCMNQPEVHYSDWEKAAEQIVETIHEPVIPDRLINVIEYTGMKPDVAGTFDFREGVQRAINEIAAKGGGTILFPHVDDKDAWIKQIITYRFDGPIHLKSNVELSFGPSTRIYFDFNPDNYMVEMNGKKGVLRRFEGTTMYSYSPLFYAFNQENIKFSFAGGEGAMPVIDGNGMKWLDWATKNDSKRIAKGMKTPKVSIRDINNDNVPLQERYFNTLNEDAFRPDLMMFFMCRNIMIEGIKLENSPFWMVHPVFSENMIFRNILFDGQVANNDAFDIESSRNVLIENIQFNNYDDNLAVKSGRDFEGRNGIDVSGVDLFDGVSNFALKDNILGAPTGNVVLRNSVFKGHHAISIGSEMSGGAKNIYAYGNYSPIQVDNALYLKSSRKRGGTIENVYFFNNKFTEVNTLVNLIPNYDGDFESPHVPEFKNIYVSNVTAKVGTYGIRMIGWPEIPIKNVQMFNITIDSVINKNSGLIVKNSRQVRLSNVSISGKHYDEIMISDVDSTYTPPMVK